MSRIHEIIAQVSKEVGSLMATQKQGSAIKFAYRGVDDVVGHVADKLNEYGVVYYPISVQKDVTGRDLPGAKYLTTTSLIVTYEFVASEDASAFHATAPGLAQDYADRSDAQAMSVALRTVLIQLFKLQGTGDKDPEVSGEEASQYADKANAEAKAAAKPTTPKARTAAQLVKEVQARIADKESSYDGKIVNELGAKHSGGKTTQEWMKDAAVLTKILASMDAGEVA
jgi:hypothetical protein